MSLQPQLPSIQIVRPPSPFLISHDLTFWDLILLGSNPSRSLTPGSLLGVQTPPSLKTQPPQFQSGDSQHFNSASLGKLCVSGGCGVLGVSSVLIPHDGHAQGPLFLQASVSPCVQQHSGTSAVALPAVPFTRLSVVCLVQAQPLRAMCLVPGSLSPGPPSVLCLPVITQGSPTPRPLPASIFVSCVCPFPFSPSLIITRGLHPFMYSFIPSTTGFFLQGWDLGTSNSPQELQV